MIHKNKTYIIAEVGINHNGSLDNCLRLIDVSAAAGCDCVKFQYFRAAGLYPRSAGRLDWQDKNKKYSYDIYSAVESFEMPSSWIRPVIGYCRKRRVDFLASVFDRQGVDFLISHGMRAIKIASTALTNIPLLEHCARFKLPLIVSTGAATLSEIEEAVACINKFHDKIWLLQCTLKYPAAPQQCNLGAIKTLKSAFPGCGAGFSDHTALVSRAAVQAVYLGAGIIEKHITLDKQMPGPDHFFALEPAELKQMVREIRTAEKKKNRGAPIDRVLYGSTEKKVFEYERYLRDFCYMAIFAQKKIKKNARIKYADLVILRPGKKSRGLEPKFLTLFKKYKIFSAKTVKKGEPLDWEGIFRA